MARHDSYEIREDTIKLFYSILKDIKDGKELSIETHLDLLLFSPLMKQLELEYAGTSKEIKRLVYGSLIVKISTILCKRDFVELSKIGLFFLYHEEIESCLGMTKRIIPDYMKSFIKYLMSAERYGLKNDVIECPLSYLKEVYEEQMFEAWKNIVDNNNLEQSLMKLQEIFD